MNAYLKKMYQLIMLFTFGFMMVKLYPIEWTPQVLASPSFRTSDFGGTPLMVDTSLGKIWMISCIHVKARKGVDANEQTITHESIVKARDRTASGESFHKEGDCSYGDSYRSVQEARLRRKKEGHCHCGNNEEERH